MLTRRQKIDRAKQIIAAGQQPPPPRYSLPCIHEESIHTFCTTCTGTSAELRHVRGCSLHEQMTRGTNQVGMKSCLICPDYEVETAAWEPGLTVRFDEYNLFPNLPGKRFNSSLIRWENGYVLCWRNGWAGSDLFVCRMNGQLQPVGPATKLEIHHPDAAYGREDPRLFVFRGQLHVSFTGVVGQNGRLAQTNVLYASLGPKFAVEQVFAPRYHHRAQSEKNWMFFEHDDELHCVYSIFPHRVLTVMGERIKATVETQVRFPWHGGEPRGGPAPVLVGDEWWAFFHDRIESTGLRIYRTGLYTFDRDPPWTIRRYLPRPIVVADTSNKPADQYAAVVWTAGAVRDGHLWHLCDGIHDRWTEIHQWTHEELKSRLRPV